MRICWLRLIGKLIKQLWDMGINCNKGNKEFNNWWVLWVKLVIRFKIIGNICLYVWKKLVKVISKLGQLYGKLIILKKL